MQVSNPAGATIRVFSQKESDVKKQLFQYAVLKHPRQIDTGLGSEVVLPPSDWVLAANKQEVESIAHRAIPEEEMPYFDQLEVVVRPFCG